MSSWSPADFGLPLPWIDALTATGTNQATAFLLTKKINVFSTVAAGTGALLPGSYAPGAQITIMNRGANALTLYPAPGDIIEAGSANASIAIGVGENATLMLTGNPMGPEPMEWRILWLGPTSGLATFDSMNPLWGAAGNLKQLKATVTPVISGGGPKVTIGASATPTATVTAAVGSNMITITGSQPVTAAQIGLPISVPGAGLNGDTLRGIILGFANSGSDQSVYLADPSGANSNFAFVQTAISGSVTLAIGNVFTAADVGKLISWPLFNNGNGWYFGSITSFVDTNNVNVSPNASGGAFVTKVSWGTDDSAALNNLCVAALAAGSATVTINAHHYAQYMNEFAAYVRPQGSGTLFKYVNAPNQAPPNTAGTHLFIRHVIPANAPPPTQPTNDIAPSVQLTHYAASATPTVVFLGASTFLQDPGVNGGSTGIVSAIRRKMQHDRPDKTHTFLSRAIGSQTVANYDSIPTNFLPWYTNHAQLWVGSDSVAGYVHADSPTLVFVEQSANDGSPYSNTGNTPTTGAGFNFYAFLDLMANMTSWASPPDIVLVPTEMNSLAESAQTVPIENVSEAGSYQHLFAKSYATVYDFGLIDARRQISKLRDGFDPFEKAFRITVPEFTTLSASTKFNDYLEDWAVTTQYSARPTTFWTAVGGEVQFTIGNQSGNLLRIGYDSTGTWPGSTTDRIYYQVDIATAYPGAGAKGGTVPTVWLNVSITSGANALTLGTGVLVAGDDGKIFTIPGAGAAGVPLVGYLHYISATTATMFSDAGLSVPLNAGTTLAANPQVILRGNPRIYTSLACAADASANAVLSFWCNGPQVGFEWQFRDDFVYEFAAVRFGSKYQPVISASGSGMASNWTVPRNAVNTAYFYIGQPRLNQTSVTDMDLSGPSGWLNPGGLGFYGGGGEKHPSEIARRVIYAPVVDAARFV